MKKTNKIFGLLALVLLAGGCVSEFEPYGPVESSAFWKTEADVKSAVNAFYDYVKEEEVAGRGHYWLEVCSDNMVVRNSATNADPIKWFQMDPGSPRGNVFWQWMYRIIARTNDVLRNVPEMNISQEVKDNAIGEAYFFRGYSYLWVAPWYGDNGVNGGIPILTETTPTTEIDMPRAPKVTDNYDMIIADLQKASELVPLFSQLPPADYGRPHKAACWAFAARAALYAAQWDPKYYDVVIEMCDKVIGLGGADARGLYPDFTKLFTSANNFSEEYIYSLLGNKNGGARYHGVGFENGGFGAHNTYGYFPPTAELYEAFEPNDVRRDATLLSPGQHIQFIGRDIHYTVNPMVTTAPAKLHNRKFMSIFEPADCLGTTVNTSGDNFSNEMGTVVMRFADVLLMKAEALIWKNEGDAVAKGLLNQIRKRAGLPENSGGTKADLKQERRVELAYEFLPSRHLDLVRWGDAQTEYAKPLHGFDNIVYVTDGIGDTIGFDAAASTKREIWGARTFNPTKHHVFPIPQNTINSAKNLVQNVGY
ncbi:membrane protein [Bacteroidia bacterium]|nr:membrane protein [Bacteroidia bacterium]